MVVVVVLVVVVAVDVDVDVIASSESSNFQMFYVCSLPMCIHSYYFRWDEMRNPPDTV